MTILTRIEAEGNIHRFYVANVTQTLFGEWVFLREWGRVGSPGTVRAQSFTEEQEARTAERRSIRRRLRHGYRECAA